MGLNCAVKKIYKFTDQSTDIYNLCVLKKVINYLIPGRAKLISFDCFKEPYKNIMFTHQKEDIDTLYINL
jgi:hypothetical protein